MKDYLNSEERKEVMAILHLISEGQYLIDGNTLTNAMWIDTSDPTNVLVKFPIPGGLDSKGNPINISWIAINTWQ